MEFRSTPGTYAAVDPFKPSISFSIKKLLGSQRSPPDDTDLHSPPPRAAFSTRRYLSPIPRHATAAVDPSWATWVPAPSSPSLDKVRIPGFQPPPDNWIPQASDSRIQIPPPHEFQDPDLHGHALVNDSIYSLPAANSANPRRRDTSPYQHSVRSRRRRSRSSSPSGRGRIRPLPPSSPMMLRKPSPPTSLSRADERLHFDFQLRHRSRSSSPLERGRERSRSARRYHRSRSRSRSPVLFRRGSRSNRRSRSPSSRSDNRAPMVIVPELSSEPLTLPPIAMAEPLIMAHPSIIGPSSLRSSSASRSSSPKLSRSRTPPVIIPHHHSPALISVERPQSSPLPSLFSREGSDASYAYGVPSSTSPNSISRPFSYPQMMLPPLNSIPSRAAEEPNVRRPIVIQPPRQEFYLSHTPDINEKIQSSVPVSIRRTTISSAVQPPREEIRPVGFWDSSDSIHVMTYVAAFVLDTIPRQLYLYFLLRLPYMYFSRVTRIFEEAEMSMPQIKQGILDAAIQLKEPVKDVVDARKLEPVESIQYSKLQNTWQSFIDSLMREWKTLNIISVLLLSAILTILQIQSAANDPFIRYSALLSMVCALMSLFYGCIYIIRFGTMRKTYKAAEWAQEAQTSRTGLFWNVWVLLAMPATWLAWSMIMYIICIMSFVWRTGTTDDANRGPMTPEDALAFRIIVSVVLSLGLIYFVLIASTLRKYGEMMDQAWHRRIIGWVNDTVAPAPYRASSSGHISAAPVAPLVSSAWFAAPSKYPPTAKSGFGPTLNLYSTVRPNPESKDPTVRSEPASSARSRGRSSKHPLRSPSPSAVSFINLIAEPDSGIDNKSYIPISQTASKEEILSRDLKIPSNTPPPPPPLFSVSAPAPAQSLRLSEAAPNEVQHHIVTGSNLSQAITDEIHDEPVIDPNLSQEPIKLARLLFLSFEGDHPLDVPPLEDELKACHMTEELWKKLQMDAQQFWHPSYPETMALTLHEWNTNVFYGHGAQIALCEVFPDTYTEPSRFAFYFFSSAKALPPAEGNNYSPLHEGLRQLDIFDFSPPPIITLSDVAVLMPEDIPTDRHWARKISLISGNLDVSARRGLSDVDLDNGISPVNSDSPSLHHAST